MPIAAAKARGKHPFPFPPRRTIKPLSGDGTIRRGGWESLARYA